MTTLIYIILFNSLLTPSHHLKLEFYIGFPTEIKSDVLQQVLIIVEMWCSVFMWKYLGVVEYFKPVAHIPKPLVL